MKLTEAGPGRWRATLPAMMPGVWRVTDGMLSAFAAAGASNPLEISDLRATATKLQPIADASGGGIHWLEDRSGHPVIPELRRSDMDRAASGGDWIGLERRNDHLVTGVASLRLLPAWVALPLMLGLLIATWRREGT